MTKKNLPVLLLFSFVSLVPLFPGLFSFFDPQDFFTFLNPLARGDSFQEYMVEGWSWIDQSLGARVGFFRPLTSLTYIPEVFLWGARPWLFRAVSLLFHGLSCLAVMRIASFAGKDGIKAGLLAAAVPGALYAVWLINGRGDVLAPLFGLMAVAATMDFLRTVSRTPLKALLPGMMCLLAMASKEQGLASVPACLLVCLLFPRERSDRQAVIPFILGLLAAGGLYLLSRLLLFQGIGGYTSLTPLSLMPRHSAALVFQVTGAGLLPFRFLRWLYLLALALPVVLFAKSSRRNLRISTLLVLLIPLLGFQSIVGDTCVHYIFGPAMGFALLLGVSLGSLPPAARRVYMVFMIVPWVILGWLEAVRLDRLSRPFEETYRATELVLPGLFEQGPAEPVLVYLPHSARESHLLSEAKNIPVYLDHLSGGRTPFQTGALSHGPVSGELSMILWTSRAWVPADHIPGHGTVLLWNGEVIDSVLLKDFSDAEPVEHD
jgi:hypothetical protein